MPCLMSSSSGVIIALHFFQGSAAPSHRPPPVNSTDGRLAGRPFFISDFSYVRLRVRLLVRAVIRAASHSLPAFSGRNFLPATITNGSLSALYLFPVGGGQVVKTSRQKSASGIRTSPGISI